MKSNRLAKWALWSLLILSAGAASATDITWGNSAGNTDWLSGASWSGGNAPGSNDVAVFPASSAVPLAQPTLNGATNVNAIKFQAMSSQANSWQINGSGTLTIMGSPGTSGYGLQIESMSWNTYIYPNIVLGGPQTWWYDLQSGNPFLYLYGTLSGTGPLTKLGRFPIYYANNTPPTFSGGLIVTNSNPAASRYGIVQWNLTGLTASSALGFGTGAITLDGGFSGKAGFGLFPQRPSGGTLYLQTLTNEIIVAQNGGFLNFDSGGSGTWLPAEFAGPVTMKGPLLLTDSGAGAQRNTWLRNVVLDRNVAGTKGLYVGFDTIAGNDYATIGWVVSNITDGASGPFGASPLVLRCRPGPWDPLRGGLWLVGAANNYAGGTVVEFSGDTIRNVVPGGAVFVDAAAKLGTGDVLVMPGGRLGLLANASIAAGKALRLESTPNIASAVILPSTGVPTALTSDSEGYLVIDWWATRSSALDLATAGNGRMFLGGRGDYAAYSATSLSPGVGNVYRLGGGFAINHVPNVLNFSSTALSLGDVGGVCSLQVGRSGYGGNGIVTLRGNNTFSGELRVVGQPSFHDIDAMSELQGYAKTTAGQSPFGAAAGPVRLQQGRLRLYGVSGGQTVNKGALTFDGVGVVAVDATSSGYATKIEVDTLVRTNRSVLLFDAVRNSAQVNEKFVVTNGAPAVVNGIVAPYLLATAGVDYWQTHFATYDSVNGFGKTSYVTMPSPGAGTEVVSYGGAVSGSPSIWALKTTGALSGSGTITINGGGLILGQSIAPNINFGAAEGVIFSDQINPNNCNITGKISGSGGLTLAGGGVRLSNVGNDFSGLITIAHGNRVGGPGAMAMAELDTAPATTRSLGNADNDLFLNGGVFCNWSATGNALLASRAVTLGPLGGYFLGYSGYPYTIYGPISGEGFLVLTGTMQGNYGPPDVTLDASGNTYSGGTRVCGWLTVNAGSSVGTGPVMLHYGSATFKGNANISTNARLQVCLDTKAYFQSATPAVGSLVGAGKVQLGATGVDTTLTVGQDNSDGAFLGEISQFAGRTGSVVKEGSGTWTLHGRHLYTGATTVNAGTLKLRGSLAGGLTIGSGGKLAVDLGPDGASYGAVAGAVTLGGTLTLNLADGYQPAVGQSWTLIGGASGFSGGFSSVTPAGYKAVASGGNLVLSRVPSGTVFFLR